MKINKNFIIMIFAVMILSVGCNNESNQNSIESNKETSQNQVNENNMNEIENHIPYIDEMAGTIDNTIIDKRYENVKKEDLTYDRYNEQGVDAEIYYADPISNDTLYKDILRGFTYFSESNPCNLTYNQSIELVKSILPDDIEQVDSVIDDEVNKEYIYYKSDKGNFRVGLCYGYIMTDEGEKIDDTLIVGIDYYKEF